MKNNETMHARRPARSKSPYSSLPAHDSEMIAVPSQRIMHFHLDISASIQQQQCILDHIGLPHYDGRKQGPMPKIDSVLEDAIFSRSKKAKPTNRNFVARPRF